MIRVGCCGWPVGREEYFRHFGLVEIQESFYNFPQIKTVERWRATAPKGFEFVLKAPQLVTHEASSPTYRRLRQRLTNAQKPRYGAFKPTREVHAAWHSTLALAKALRSRLVLFQCPASFTPTPAHKKNLKAFFKRIDRGGLFLAWEPRGAWEDAEIKTLCRALELIHCVDPFQRASVWGAPSYFRLHGKGGYHYQYMDSELKEILLTCRKSKESYVLFNNSAMFEDARRFKAIGNEQS
jgi:uncharacterized protein YecE (DUF72 family)